MKIPENGMSTIIDVARKAGVSPMTVSRYFNQPELVRPATQERVRKAVEQLGYVPNQAARSLVQGRTKTLALVLPDVTNTFFTTLARGAEDQARKLDYALMLGNTDETYAKESKYLEMLFSQRVDGIILSPVLGPNREHNMEMLIQRNIPFVLIDRKIDGFEADLVRGDSFEGGRMLVQHLVEQGFRDIAFIGGTPGVSAIEDRLSGYRTAMQEAGLPERVYLGRNDVESGKEITTQLISDGALPRALIGANNVVGVGALSVLRSHGLRVPEDVALACIDDIEIAALIDPFLTVVAQPAYDIGALACKILLDRINGQQHEPSERVLPVELIVRRSSIKTS